MLIIERPSRIVAHVVMGKPGGGGDFGGDPGTVRVIDVGKNNASALAGHDACVGPAEPLGGAGDDSDLALQPSHGVSLPFGARSGSSCPFSKRKITHAGSQRK